MTYKELIEQLKIINVAYETNFKVKNDGQFVSIYLNNQTYANFSNNESYCVDLWGLGFTNLEDNLRHDILKVAYKFAQTPVDARHLFTKFYISSKLTPKVDEKFLFKFGGNIDHLAWGFKNGGGTEFTQEEIDYICDKFDTDLSDFNIEEVK